MQEVKCFFCNQKIGESTALMAGITLCQKCKSILISSGIKSDMIDLALSNPKLYMKEIREFMKIIDQLAVQEAIGKLGQKQKDKT